MWRAFLQFTLGIKRNVIKTIFDAKLYDKWTVRLVFPIAIIYDRHAAAKDEFISATCESSYLFNRKGIKLQLPQGVIINNILLFFFILLRHLMLVWSLAKQLSSLKKNLFKSAIFCNGVHTVNSK